VASRRGFFAELNHQAQLRERERLRDQQAAHRAWQAAARRSEQAQRAAERARAAAARTSAVEARAAEKEIVRLHAEARTAEVDAANAALESTYAEIDSLLTATLDVDDWVDLESLRMTVEQPPFTPSAELLRPVLPPGPPRYPPAPVYQEPPAPTGTAAMLGGRKRHEAAVRQAREQYAQACHSAQVQADAMHAAYQQQAERSVEAERDRQAKLAVAREAYARECREAEAQAAERNAALDQLINDLAFDVESAIEEYVGIVLSNSVYPGSFPVSHEHRFDLSTRELVLTVRVPQPSEVPTVRQYRWVKAKDEIASTALPVKEQKERYASAVCQVAVRSLHEVFEADRAGRIHSIALTVCTGHLDPATGHSVEVPLVIAGADRDTFSSFDLRNVVPAATLEHLGASVSSRPAELVPADVSRGVRTSRAR
jgi:restriction system protein